VASPNSGKGARLYFWERFVLQKLLFKRDFDRKPVSLALFRVFWLAIINKRALMPLVNQKGIYCFFSKELIRELAKLFSDKKCLEIGAGDGALTRLLAAQGVSCVATDDHSWDYYIKYPDFVEKADAREALSKYNPEIVICSWPVPGNAYEKYVFRTRSVDMYVVIGSKNPRNSGDYETYNQVKDFALEAGDRLSSLVLPPSDENAVLIFRRKHTV
jgi:hypothetical protein